MEFPKPDPRGYATFTAVALLTFAALQYTGTFFENPGQFDIVFLASVGVLLPVSAYLWSVVLANTPLPDWEKINRTDGE
jgi:hypothetical protein